jgi:TRAP-type C4-dicarboxylate transport system substrate-binding protein
VLVSQKAFDALDKPTQDALLKVSAEAEARGWKTSEDKTKFYMEQLTKNGMTVAPPSAALKADLKKVGDTMIGEWQKTAGAEGQAILDAYKK